MSLPEDYLRYPLRRRGMDHDRYEWSILFRRKRIEWPNGARVALWIVPALEWFPLDSDNKPFRPPGGLERPYPDYRYYTHRDYGNRVGIFRIYRVLDRLGLKASVAINAALAARQPSLVEEVERRGWEIIAHGLDMAHVHHGGLAPEAEAGIVREALATLRGIAQTPVTGWLSPGKSESRSTLDLIAAEGIAYVCDWPNDDMPYRMKTESGRLYAMPHSEEMNDRVLLLQFHHSEADFAQQLKDQFDRLYVEAADHGGRIMAITVHPWIIGQPYRIKALDEALSYMAHRPKVWPATGAEILEAFRAQE